MNGGSSKIIKKVFSIREENRYNLRHQNNLKRPIVNSVYSEIETVSLLSPKKWELIPKEINNLVSLNGFEKAVKKKETS